MLFNKSIKGDKMDYYTRKEILNRKFKQIMQAAIQSKRTLNPHQVIDMLCDETGLGELTIKKFFERKQKAGLITVDYKSSELFVNQE